MAKHKATNLNGLVTKLNSKPAVINKAASIAVNKTTQFAVGESIDLITTEVNLDPSYVRKHLKQVARANPNNLRAVIRANARATLLTRYPFTQTKQGVNVRVNARGGVRRLPKAFVVKNLRGSGASGVALRNKDAVAYFTKFINKGTGRTPGKQAKLNKIRAKAANKPHGVTVLHGRSINQLFTSVREDISDDIRTTMSDIFLGEFGKLNK